MMLTVHRKCQRHVLAVDQNAQGDKRWKAVREREIPVDDFKCNVELNVYTDILLR